MKKTCIKILSVVLCAVMVLGSAPLGGLVGIELPSLFDFKAEAATYSGKCGDNLIWSLDTSTGVLNITGTGAMYRYNFSNMPEFLNYSISAVTIENGVTSIGSYAFFDCVQMKSVSIPGSVETIGGWAFAGCDNLESIIIPDGVNLISNGAFCDCDALKIVTISATVTRIREDSFSSCDNLKDVYYTGTENEWNEILIGDFNDPLKNANIHFKDISDETVIPAPSQTTIKYGDSIILHVDPAKIPEGGYVEWVASNNNFTFNVSNVSKTCKIKPSVSGSTTFTATVYDEDGKPVLTDEQTMTSKAGFFDKLIAFFKSIFGLSKIYEY